MSAVIGKQVLAFGKSEKSEFINIGTFAASSEGVKGGAITGGLRQIGGDHMYVRCPATALISLDNIKILQLPWQFMSKLNSLKIIRFIFSTFFTLETRVTLYFSI